MSFSVRERGETVATLRWIHVRLMETIASWIPTTPEMEIKLLFGTHVWDLAQHADALGKRTYELRMPLQHSQAPVATYEEWLANFSAIEDSSGRLSCFYEVVLPSLFKRYAHYLGQTDRLLDAPTVRIIEHIGSEQTRMISEGVALIGELAALPKTSRERIEEFASREREVGEFVAHRTDKRSTKSENATQSR